MSETRVCGQRVPGPFTYNENADDSWREDGTCPYCGSENPEAVLAAIEAEMVEIRPTDKSYKIYLFGTRPDGVRFGEATAGVGKAYFQDFSDDDAAGSSTSMSPSAFATRGAKGSTFCRSSLRAGRRRPRRERHYRHARVWAVLRTDGLRPRLTSRPDRRLAYGAARLQHVDRQRNERMPANERRGGRVVRMPRNISIGDKYGPAMKVTDADEARAYFEACVRALHGFWQDAFKRNPSNAKTLVTTRVTTATKRASASSVCSSASIPSLVRSNASDRWARMPRCKAESNAVVLRRRLPVANTPPVQMKRTTFEYDWNGFTCQIVAGIPDAKGTVYDPDAMEKALRDAPGVTNVRRIPEGEVKRASMADVPGLVERIAPALGIAPWFDAEAVVRAVLAALADDAGLTESLAQVFSDDDPAGTTLHAPGCNICDHHRRMAARLRSVLRDAAKGTP